MGFGKSKQTSNNQSQQTSASSNQAFPFLQSALGDQVANVGKGSNALASILGLDGSGAQNSAFDTFRNSSSYNFIKDEGIRGITGNNASKGLLSSGSAARGIADYTTGLAGNFLNSYLSNLLGLSNTGIQAGGIISGAGNTSTSQGTSSGTSGSVSRNLGLG